MDGFVVLSGFIEFRDLTFAPVATTRVHLQGLRWPND